MYIYIKTKRTRYFPNSVKELAFLILSGNFKIKNRELKCKI